MVLIGKYLYLIVILIAVAYIFFQSRETQKKIIILSLISLPLTYVVGFIAGKLYYDPRPFVVEHIKPLIQHAANNGFPSDHTLISTALAAIIFIFNKKLGIILGILALLVGIARIYARIHSPIDVAGSFLISIVVMTIIVSIIRKFFRYGI